jgi:hypothetical protein
MAKKVEQIIDPPDSEVKITMAYCNDCNKVQYAAVTHRIGKDGKKTLSEYAANGHKIESIPLLEYQAKNDTDWWCKCSLKEKTNTKK